MKNPDLAFNADSRAQSWKRGGFGKSGAMGWTLAYIKQLDSGKV